MRRIHFLFIASVVLGAWLATPFVIRWLYPELEEQGQFGDMYGSINALFSGLALGGAIIAIILQSQELKLQREELVNQREELKNQRQEMERNNELFKKQNEILQKQFDAAVAVQEAAETKARIARLPQFVHLRNTPAPRTVSIDYRNDGAVAYDLQFSLELPECGFKVLSQPMPRLEAGRTISIVFGFPRPNIGLHEIKFAFLITFTTALDETIRYCYDIDGLQGGKKPKKRKDDRNGTPPIPPLETPP